LLRRSELSLLENATSFVVHFSSHLSLLVHHHRRAPLPERSSAFFRLDLREGA
jgi:hypothetical protein